MGLRPGRVATPTEAGGAAASANPLASPLAATYEYGANLAPREIRLARPGYASPPPLPELAITYAGLAPGEVGVYQINFVVPQPPPGTPRCGGAGAAGPLSIHSNLTISIGGQDSFDGVGICVDTESP